MKHEGSSGAELPPPAAARLRRYALLLERRAVPLGLISRSDAPHLWGRHIEDSLRAVDLVPTDADVADLGSGAGLPGVPLAIALPASRFTLVEARRTRVAFLELVVEEVGLPNVRVAAMRVEELPRSSFDICVSRGFADPAQTWAAAGPLLREAGRLIYWAGVTFDASTIPSEARVERVRGPGLESGGPIVIMARQ